MKNYLLNVDWLNRPTRLHGRALYSSDYPFVLSRILMIALVMVIYSASVLAQPGVTYPNRYFFFECNEGMSMLEIVEDQDGEFGDPQETEIPCGGEGGPDPELESEEDTTSAPPGGDDDCDDDLSTDDPVALRWGSKLESVADLTIRIPGRDYKLMRRFSSNTVLWPSDLRGHVGDGWAMSPFQFLEYGLDGGGHVETAWYVHGGDSKMRFDRKDGLGNEREFSGPPNSTITGYTDDYHVPGGTDEFEIRNEGNWTRIFANYDHDPISGVLLHEYDEFGNQVIYNWTMGYSWNRLGYISLWNPDLTTEYAVLKFYWNDDNRVSSIQVFRPDGTIVIESETVTKYVWTQEVRYTYKSDSGNFSNDLGPASALVQVEYLTATDGTTQPYIDDSAPTDRLSEPGSEGDELVSTPSNVRRQVRQYRYGDGYMVINPEQLEYYSWKTGNDPADLLEEDNDTTVISGEGVTTEDLAAKIVTFYTSGDYSGNVYQQLIQTDCGCGGSSSQGKRLTYSYYDVDNSDLDDPGTPPGGFSIDTDIVRTIEVLEERWNGSSYVGHRKIWYDMIEISTTYQTEDGTSTIDVPERFLRYKATVDLNTSDTWVEAYDYYGQGDDFGGEAQKRKKYFPSAVQYQRSSGDERPYVKFNSNGLVELYTYYTTESHAARLRTISVADVTTAGEPGDALVNDDYGSLIVRYEYRVGNREDLIAQVERFRTDNYAIPDFEPTGGDANNIEVTTYTYDLAAAAVVKYYIEERTTKVEKELESENGPASVGTYETIETFNRDGTLASIRYDDDSILKYTYDSLHGGMTSETSTHAAYESSQTLPEPLETTMAYDLLGRMTRITYPNLATTNIWRELRVHPDDTDFNGATGDIDRYVEISVPSDTGAGAGDGHDYDGPIVLTYYNAGDRAIGSLEYPAQTSEISRDSNGDLTAEPVDSGSPPATQLGRTYMERDLAGLVQTERRYHDTANNGYYEDVLDYDELGRLLTSETDTGTIMRYTYDIFDRVIAEEIGTDDGGGGNMRTVAEYVYDDGGVGDGNLTDVHRYTTDDDQDPNYQRTTSHVYDFRNRRIKTINALEPHLVLEYDNLDRVIKRGLVTGTGIAAATLDDSDSERGMYEEYDYSQRGLMFRRARAIVASETPGSAEFIEWHTWYDEVGRPIAEWGPNAPATKIAYDALGRVGAVYTTDRGGDASPGESGNYADVGVAADFLDDDIVLEQVEYRYVDESSETQSRGEGEVDLVTRFLRAHDVTGYPTSGQTGDLSSASGSQIVKTYTGYYYDDAGRQVRVVEFGTNDDATDVFMTGAQTPDPDQSDPIDYDDMPAPSSLITQLVHGTRGLVETAIAPDETVTKYFYDDLNRQVGVIENFSNGVVERDAVAAGGWELTDNDAGSGNQDEDRATIFAYDGADNLTHRIAAFYDGSGIDYQITEYIYGADSTSTTQDIGSTEMEIDSADLLREVIYPDEFGAGTPKSVLYAYNLLGEVMAMEDQNETVHEYERDDLGRIASDGVTTFGTNIDETIDEIEISYDTMGRRKQVTSLKNSSIKNLVEFAYTDLWQVDTVTQDPLYNPSNTNEDDVDYDYKDVVIDGDNDAIGNYSRLLTVKYPSNPGANRTSVAYSYGSDLQSGSADKDDPEHRISRFTELMWTGPTTDHVAAYDWLGMSTLATKTYTMIGLSGREGVRLDRFHRPSTGGSTTSGRYYGYDRFGRVKHQLWYDYESGDTDGWNQAARPAIVELEYTYDNAHNVMSRNDVRANRKVTIDGNPDEVYAYDGLDRLETAQRGNYDHSGPSFTLGGTRAQDWSLDALGNWLAMKTDTDHDGSFTGGADINDARTFTLANELVDRTITGYPSALDFTFDDAGNRTGREVNLDQSGANDLWTYVYDAWNRLVEVKVDALGDETDVETRVRYTYNGLHQRVTRRANTDADLTLDGDDEGNLYYYDAAWRLVEERIDDAWDGSSTTFAADSIVQRVWCPTYIDALIAMMTDVDDDETLGDTGDPDGDFTDPDATIFYALQDRKHDVIVLMDENGLDRERVRYTPYGVARHMPRSDINGDGFVNGTDLAQRTAADGETISTSGYRAEIDFDRDGDIDSVDNTTLVNNWSATAEPEGVISRFGNTVGYSGYVYDEAVDLSLARFRWYDAEAGRWLTRDPLEYFDGSNVFMYCMSNPRSYVDPLGLASVAITPAAKGAAGLISSGAAAIGADVTAAGATLAAAGGKAVAAAAPLAVPAIIIGGTAGSAVVGAEILDTHSEIAALNAALGTIPAVYIAQAYDQIEFEGARNLIRRILDAWRNGKRNVCGVIKGYINDTCKSLQGCKGFSVHGECGQIRKRAVAHAECAAARFLANVACGFGSKSGYDRSRQNHVNAAAKCAARYLECQENARKKTCPK